jgi:SAM-dependent methyltransferase
MSRSGGELALCTSMFASYPVYRFQVASSVLFAMIARKRCFGYEAMKSHLKEKSGLEFGGPSSIFTANHLIPIYDIAHSIDNGNYAPETIWTSRSDHLRFGSRFGKHLIVEAGDASRIASESYDFVAASHVLEHVANPLRALQEWKRIVKPSGTILLILPHKANTFDHRRPFTTFDHIRADFESNVTEGDLTHLQEILELHEMDMDPPAGSREQFRTRCLQNRSKRAMHHHVFSPELIIEMCSFLEMRVLNVAVERPYHIVVHAKKRGLSEQTNVHLENAAFLDAEAEWRKHDPFRMQA